MRYLLALGGNVASKWGNPADTISRGVKILSERVGADVVMSRLYRTPAFPAGAGPDFVNAVARVDCAFDPQDMLEFCHAVEQQAERHRLKRWGPRTLDLDLIACEGRVHPDAKTQDYWRSLSLNEQISQVPQDLILPHPRLQDRAFVLVPMMDVAPDWQHPLLALTTAQMLERLPVADKDAVTPLDLV